MAAVSIRHPVFILISFDRDRTVPIPEYRKKLLKSVNWRHKHVRLVQHYRACPIPTRLIHSAHDQRASSEIIQDENSI
jgi:hypothetical protein